MDHPQYYLAHHPSNSSSIANAAHFSMPSAPAHRPPYQLWYTTHVKYAGTSPTLARQPLNPRYHATHTSRNSKLFLKLKERNIEIKMKHLVILFLQNKEATFILFTLFKSSLTSLCQKISLRFFFLFITYANLLQIINLT